MTIQEKIIKELTELNELQRSGKSGLTHKQYLAKYNRIKNQNSVANQVKAFGAKVTKEEGFKSGYYVYHGVNFTAKFNEESCEHTWWEVNLWEDGTDERLEACFGDYNHYTTKNEVVIALLNTDKEMSANI